MKDFLSTVISFIVIFIIAGIFIVTTFGCGYLIFAAWPSLFKMLCAIIITILVLSIEMAAIIKLSDG